MRWAPPALLMAYAAVHRLGRTYGSTARERQASMPGDDLVSKPQFVATHGITIDAAPESVWPWLVQMGWHRGGWYTARWVDKLLFPANRAAPITLSKSFKISRWVTSFLTAYRKLNAGSLSSNLNGRNFSFCIPRLICHWNGAATVRRRWTGAGFSMLCRWSLTAVRV
jgi:hypothetical protein